VPAKVYVAPLRHAVLILGRRGEPWTLDAMCVMGDAKESGAKIYANRLAGQSIIVARPDGLYQVGKGFAAWAKLKPRTRPGGGRVNTYKAIPATAV